MGARMESPGIGRRGVMREGECGAGATMPSDEVSIGDEPPEPVDVRGCWKVWPWVTTGGMPLAGRTSWRASQNLSDTTVRAGEAPWDAATALSISTMVSVTVVVGMWAMAASTAAFCSWERVGGIPALRLSARSSHRISGWEDDSQRAMGWDGTVTPSAASL
jgi:hypothetical protein